METLMDVMACVIFVIPVSAILFSSIGEHINQIDKQGKFTNGRRCL